MPGKTVMIDTKLQVEVGSEMQKRGYFAMVLGRSGLASRGIIAHVGGMFCSLNFMQTVIFFSCRLRLQRNRASVAPQRECEGRSGI